jgi:hypothetical protein
MICHLQVKLCEDGWHGHSWTWSWMKYTIMGFYTMTCWRTTSCCIFCLTDHMFMCTLTCVTGWSWTHAKGDSIFICFCKRVGCHNARKMHWWVAPNIFFYGELGIVNSLWCMENNIRKLWVLKHIQWARLLMSHGVKTNMYNISWTIHPRWRLARWFMIYMNESKGTKNHLMCCAHVYGASIQLDFT